MRVLTMYLFVFVIGGCAFGPTAPRAEVPCDEDDVFCDGASDNPTPIPSPVNGPCSLPILVTTVGGVTYTFWAHYTVCPVSGGG